jgi:hypothetical protein
LQGFGGLQELLVGMVWVGLGFEKNNPTHDGLGLPGFLRVELWIDVSFLLMSTRIQH